MTTFFFSLLIMHFCITYYAAFGVVPTFIHELSKLSIAASQIHKFTLHVPNCTLWITCCAAMVCTLAHWLRSHYTHHRPDTLHLATGQRSCSTWTAPGPNHTTRATSLHPINDSLHTRNKEKKKEPQVRQLLADTSLSLQRGKAPHLHACCTIVSREYEISHATSRANTFLTRDLPAQVSAMLQIAHRDFQIYSC